MDLEQHDRPKDGISFMETALTVASMVVIAILAAAGVGMLYGKLWDEALDAQITSAHVAQATAKKDMHPCDFVIVQYGAYHEKRHPECAKGTRDLPNHILTLPVGK